MVTLPHLNVYDMIKFNEIIRKEVKLIQFHLKREGRLLKTRLEDGVKTSTYIFRSRKVEIQDNNGKLLIITPVLL